ncbi:MAG: molybdate ABC transporter substrate-binding protein [Candidatus Obscuribacterales bacterium]|nr:molybdate ABC transporter substrate-binding protein [Steroidobacteraceae bacterium]
MQFLRNVCFLFASLLISIPSPAAKPLTVFAAVSLTDALTEISTAYTKAGGVPVRLSFASSSALARQMEAGAQADIFFSADLEWVDYLQTRGLIDPTTRKNLLSNRLVLIAPVDSKIALRIAPNFPLAAAIAKSRLATGDPDSVPVGRYARSALMTLGVWGDVADRVVRADNVRVALAYVARGEASLGIVYETDALIEKKVRIVDVFPTDTHLPIVYPLAITRGAAPAAKDYAAYVGGKEAATVFIKYGFKPIN